MVRGRRWRQTRRLSYAASLLLLCAVLTGCASPYTVTFTRGTYVNVKCKPTYDKAKDSYILTDADGRKYLVPAISIREISPAESGGKPAASPYQPRPAR